MFEVSLKITDLTLPLRLCWNLFSKYLVDFHDTDPYYTVLGLQRDKVEELPNLI